MPVISATLERRRNRFVDETDPLHCCHYHAAGGRGLVLCLSGKLLVDVRVLYILTTAHDLVQCHNLRMSGLHVREVHSLSRFPQFQLEISLHTLI